jgi:hypothetical protein
MPQLPVTPTAVGRTDLASPGAPRSVSRRKSQYYHYFIKNKEGLVHEVQQSHLDTIRQCAAPLNYELQA